MKSLNSPYRYLMLTTVYVTPQNRRHINDKKQSCALKQKSITPTTSLVKAVTTTRPLPLSYNCSHIGRLSTLQPQHTSTRMFVRR